MPKEHGYTKLEAYDSRVVEDSVLPQFNIARRVTARQHVRKTKGAIDRPSTSVGQCWAKFRWGKWVIKPNPGRNCPHWIVLWDILIAGLVMVTSFYVPMQASLGLRSPLFDRLCDSFFVADMVLQFFVAQPATGGGEKSNHGLWVTDPVELGQQYMTGPFWPDLISIAPIFVSTQIHGIKGNDTRAKDIANVMHGLSICRLIRLARLERIIKRWQASSGIPFFYIELTKFFVVICFSTHWVACAWALVVRKETILMFSEIIQFDSTWLSAVIEAKGDPCIHGADNDPLCVYALSVYWSAMTLTTVGYGDITPQNLLEYIAASVIMIISGIVWAYVVGSIVSMVANSEPLEVEFKQRMDELNVMMMKHGIDLALQVRLRRYMHEAKHFHRLQGHRALLANFISPGLQREIAQVSSKAPLLSAVFWINDLDEDPYHEFVKCLDPKFYGPMEDIHATDCMIVVQSGIIAVRGQILMRGDVWGHETVLIESYALTEDRPPMSLSYVDVLTLCRADIAHVMAMHPDAAARIRKAQIRSAVFRGFLWAAKLKREGLTWEQFSNCLVSRKGIRLGDHLHHPEVHVLKALWRKDPGRRLGKPERRESMRENKANKDDNVAEATVNLKEELREEMRDEFQQQLCKLEARLPSKADLENLVETLRSPTSPSSRSLGTKAEGRANSR